MVRGPAEGPDGAFAAPTVLARSMLCVARMNDLLFVCATFAFFALGWLYVRALDRL